MPVLRDVGAYHYRVFCHGNLALESYEKLVRGSAGAADEAPEDIEYKKRQGGVKDPRVADDEVE